MASRWSSPRVDFGASNSGGSVENRTPSLPLPDSTTDSHGGEVLPLLSSELYFDVVLSKTQLSDGYRMGLPDSFSSKLPSYEVPCVFNYRGKSWNIMYKGQCKGRKWFDSGGWKTFADDNCLKIGDACIFEVMDMSKEKIIFRLQILRGNIPSKFHKGQHPDEPIVID